MPTRYISRGSPALVRLCCVLAVQAPRMDRDDVARAILDKLRLRSWADRQIETQATAVLDVDSIAIRRWVQHPERAIATHRAQRGPRRQASCRLQPCESCPRLGDLPAPPAFRVRWRIARRIPDAHPTNDRRSRGRACP